MKVMNSETFGPVVGIQRVPRDRATAVDIAEVMNDSDLGLTAGVYSKDPNIAEDILKLVDVGTVYRTAPKVISQIQQISNALKGCQRLPICMFLNYSSRPLIFH